MAPRRLNPCSYLPRRLQIVSSLVLFILLCMLILGTSTVDVPYADEVSEGALRAAKYLPKTPGLPSVLNPFRTPVHQPPPEQANSTSGEARWFSDWKWMNPFSSSITLDENRAVLPPLVKRPPVYTYFDAEWYEDETSLESVNRLLLIWRRAWWAQGFKPVVLGRPEAMNNPLYAKVGNLDLEDELKTDLMRWLAWGNMGTGILANYLALPMAAHTDPLLSYLRRGEYPQLTRYEGLENGLFNGPKDQINKAVEQVLDAKQPIKAKSVVDMLDKDTFHVDPQHEGVAFYSSQNLKKYKGLYQKLASKDKEISREGLGLLPQLIISHLHTTWQNTFSSGIAVLKPLPEHTTTLIKPSIELARNLSQCTESPFPASCPPNRERCTPCVSSHPMLLTTPSYFRNTTSLFTIGTVPHPYTTTSLHHAQDSLTIKFIRRTTKRDEWIFSATKEISGTGMSSYSRIPVLKDAIASPFGSSHSLWLTPENLDDKSQLAKDLAWTLGFPIPTLENTLASGKSETPVPGPERRPPPPKAEGKQPDPVELVRESGLLEKSKEVLKGKVRNTVPVVAAVEAWNLADTEVWRFVRAWNARRRVERSKWEDEERKFAGSEGAGKGRWS